jgi:hypothetical protein
MGMIVVAAVVVVVVVVVVGVMVVMMMMVLMMYEEAPPSLQEVDEHEGEGVARQQASLPAEHPARPPPALGRQPARAAKRRKGPLSAPRAHTKTP